MSIHVATQAQYVTEGGRHCPNCRSQNIDTLEPLESDGPIAWQQVECHDCGKQWQDNFNLNGYSKLED